MLVAFSSLAFSCTNCTFANNTGFHGSSLGAYKQTVDGSDRVAIDLTGSKFSGARICSE